MCHNLGSVPRRVASAANQNPASGPRVGNRVGCRQVSVEMMGWTVVQRCTAASAFVAVLWRGVLGRPEVPSRSSRRGRAVRVVIARVEWTGVRRWRAVSCCHGDNAALAPTAAAGLLAGEAATATATATARQEGPSDRRRRAWLSRVRNVTADAPQGRSL